MKNHIARLVWIALAAVTCTSLGAQDEPRAEVTFQAAVARETVHGDLQGAIALYDKAARAAGSDRSLAARALLNLGKAHRKLGEEKAEAVFERLVREFADQKESAEAGVHLAALRTAPASGSHGIVTRQVWTGPKVDTLGGVSRDGRFLSFVDWTTGNLAVRDLVQGTDRRLTDKGSWADSEEFAEQSIVSPDGNQVAFSWFNKDNRYDLRVSRMSGSASTRILYDNEDIDWMGPFDWSLDGSWIAVALTRKDRTGQIGLVSTADGSLRVLKSVNWQGSSKLVFSPDGRYLAYDLPQSEIGEERDVFVMAIDGSRETAAVVHPADDKVLAWTPDGRHLLFATNRSRSMDVMALPLREGRASGNPVFVKSDVGSPMSLGMSSSGALFFGVNSRGPSVQLALFDASTGSLTPSPQALQLVGASEGPAWSPDGKYLAYTSRRLTSSFRFNILAVRSVETGETRELRPQLTYFQNVRWAPDGRSVAVRGTDSKGQQGSYRIDIRSGEVTELVQGGMSLQWALDGQRVYFNRRDEQRRMSVIVERNLASGSEREIRSFSNAGPITLSPDGRHLAIRVMDRASRTGMLHVVDPMSGTSRELIGFESPDELGFYFEWTPDGRAVVVTKNPSGDLSGELWIVPLDGKPRRVKTSLRDVRGYRFQPGGNQVAFFTPPPAQAEVWVMENFLPALGSKE